MSGETVPRDEVYNPTSNKLRSKGSNKPHKSLPFMRSPSLTKAILGLKERNLFPIMISHLKMPTNEPWDNVSTVLYTLWILYSYYEGLVITSQMARQVLLYVFYGVFDGPKGRKWPVIRCVHRMVRPCNLILTYSPVIYNMWSHR